MRVDLLLVGRSPGTPIPWSLGHVSVAGDRLDALVSSLRAEVARTQADALLLWDARLGAPDAELVRTLVAGRGDVWHAGLVLGTGGQPGLMDYVFPSWMLSCDPPVDVEATSWRATFAACVVRTDVLRDLGLPCADFDTIAGAVYEWSLRALLRGAVMRHVPALAPAHPPDDVRADAVPTLRDELRCMIYRFGTSWSLWAAGRAAVTSYAPPGELLRAWQAVAKQRPYDEPAPYRPRRSLGAPDLAAARVTVLIPTLHRYPYLRVVLANLREQTVRPHEIIVVDQSALDRRDLAIADEFRDLPLRIVYQDEPGQCASRNAGLAMSTGDFVLFIDDDDELPPDLIERHLTNLARFDADVSSGVAQEVGETPLPESERFVRASDVFPTNNTVVRRDVLRRSGLFDLAFNRAPRADGELGMRVYSSGAFMVLDRSIAVLHHHASEGGLREHRARVVTYRMSREMLAKRSLPHISEIYLLARHFTARQQREAL